MWVVDYGADNKVYAYDLNTKARDADKDVDLEEKTLWGDIASDGTTMWLSETSTLDDKLYAYSISGKSSDSSKRLFAALRQRLRNRCLDRRRNDVCPGQNR